MANMKMVSLIDHEVRKQAVQRETLERDLYAALSAALDAMRLLTQRVEALETFKAETKLVVRNLKEVTEEMLIDLKARVEALERRP
jgi:hypothetical protein